MKRMLTLILGLCLVSAICAQSLIPAPFTFSSCGFGISPVGWNTCTGSPDCAASRCTVPGGCSGQAVMCFGESFYYVLPTALVVGQNYTVSMNLCVGILGGQSIVGGLHNFAVIGLTTAPTNCGVANYGAVCSTPGATTLLSGTMNTVGWQNFTNTFTATSALRYIVIGNCDNTGNGGNLFCNFTLQNSVVLPVDFAHFDVEENGCEVKTQWSVVKDAQNIQQFEIYRSGDGFDEIVGRVAAQRGRTDYEFVDVTPARLADYQIRIIYQDGSQSQSEVRRAASDCASMQALIEANPVLGATATIRYRNLGQGSTTIVVTDMGGRIVLSERVPDTGQQWQRHNLDMSHLQNGMYFVNTGAGEVLKMQVMH